MCPVCRKDFTHSASLKKHIIKNHEAEDIIEHDIDPEQVIGAPLKKQKSDMLKTSLEEMVDQKTKWANVKVDEVTFDPVRKASLHCPRLH